MFFEVIFWIAEACLLWKDVNASIFIINQCKLISENQQNNNLKCRSLIAFGDAAKIA